MKKLCQKSGTLLKSPNGLSKPDTKGKSMSDAVSDKGNRSAPAGLHVNNAQLQTSHSG